MNERGIAKVTLRPILTHRRDYALAENAALIVDGRASQCEFVALGAAQRHISQFH